eukprot:scaffold118787_cov23-Tisochrysis_lutea.AAC.2
MPYLDPCCGAGSRATRDTSAPGPQTPPLLMPEARKGPDTTPSSAASPAAETTGVQAAYEAKVVTEHDTALW